MTNISYPSFSKIIFFAFFILYLAAGWYITSYLNIYYNDTASRTANAFFTVFGRDPHLAAIGFVWLPLPSLLQIPLLLILYNVGLQMLSGPIITSFWGALSVVMVYKISLLLSAGKRSPLSLVVSFLYGINPMILLYVAIGSSETIFISSLLLFSYFFLKWYLQLGIFNLALAAFALVMAFGSRYEAIPVFIAGIILILAVELSIKSPFRKIQAIVMLFGLPFMYACVLWLLANWVIKGDPLYFLSGPYSNSSYTNGLSQNSALLENSYHSLYSSSLYAFKRILLLAPGLVLFPLILLPFNKNRNRYLNNRLLIIILVAPYFSILAFHILQLYAGQSFGWLRFFMYSQLALTLTALYAVNTHKVVRYFLIISLFFGFITTGYAMGDYNYGKEEKSFVTKIENNRITLDYSRTYSDQKAVAAFMNSKKGKILLDTSDGFAIPLFSRNPQQYVITSDVDFLSLLKNYKHSADWIIIPDPDFGNSKKNIITTEYPNIGEGELPSTQLYASIDDWKIYRVIK